GLALVTTMSILGASINKSIDAGVDREFSADFLIQNVSNQPFSPKIAEAVAEVPGVAQTSPSQLLVFDLDGAQTFASAIEVDSFQEIFTLDYVAGESPSGDDEIAVSESTSERLGVGAGDRVELGSPGADLDVTVSGVYADSNVVGQAVVPMSMVPRAGIKRGDTTLAVNVEPDRGTRTVRAALERAVGDNPTIVVQDKQAFAEAQRAQV